MPIHDGISEDPVEPGNDVPLLAYVDDALDATRKRVLQDLLGLIPRCYTALEKRQKLATTGEQDRESLMAFGIGHDVEARDRTGCSPSSSLLLPPGITPHLGRPTARALLKRVGITLRAPAQRCRDGSNITMAMYASTHPNPPKRRKPKMSLLRSAICAVTAIALLSAPTAAQHGGHHDHPAPHQKPTTKTSRTGDPYPFATCPVSGKKLGTMGDPLVKVYRGREVRFCCGGCTGSFEKDLDSSLAKLDQKVIADQRPIYPMSKSVVSGKKLPKKPVNLVLGNRLILLADAKEKATALKSPGKYLKQLDAAVSSAQGKSYPLQKCVVSNEPLDSMGKPKDVVIAGRLIRICCSSCAKKLDKTPSTFISTIDKATAEQSRPKARNGK